MDTTSIFISLTVALIVIFVFVVIYYEISTYLKKYFRQRRVANKVWTKNELAEAQIFELIDRVDANNKEGYSQMISSYGHDSQRHLTAPLNYDIPAERIKADGYFNLLSGFLTKIRSLKPKTGDPSKDYYYTISENKDIVLDGMEVIRIVLEYCNETGEERLDDKCIFDFVEGKDEFLLLDLMDRKLYQRW